jgi:2-amino-4-hydroxy-6-hydroxymethyldihydropteridine diphosphokinase
MAIYLGIGSNLGCREENLRRALALLERSGDVSIVRQSQFYETPPWGDADQDTFLNAVIEITTQLSAAELLALAKGVEREMGRRESRRWGPRLIDIDILLYGDLITATPELVIPHGRLRERAFALVPLVELAPSLRDPITGILYKDYLESLPEKNAIKVWNASDTLLRNQ